MSSLLASKLRRPIPLAGRVQRPHLNRRLNDGLASGRRLTLVSAPAGFGKTICIGDWIESLPLPASWLALDPADDDPGRFFTYLIAALQRVDGQIGQEIESILRAGQLPPGEIISNSLINDILTVDQRFVLVLDDIHLIQDPLVLQPLEQLVRNLPPALHLVLITREDPVLPLARLRASNQMTEIRVADLRFSPAEAALFLNGMMNLSLSEADIELLEDRTEGWIAGLQLAAIALQSPPVDGSTSPVTVQAERSRFIVNLSGSHRFILTYLTEEVLSRQPSAIRDFLLQSSILDRLNGDLCDAVTGRTDSHALLEHLLATNLFLTPLDDEGRWYRYHQLFADLLRDLLGARPEEDSAELHRRASRWYAQAEMIPEAVQHALAAADYETAVQLIERHVVKMFLEWHAKTLRGWMQAIPPEWSATSPKINLAFAWMHLSVFEIAEAMPYIKRLEAMYPDPQAVREEDSSIRAEWMALQSSLLNAQGRPAEGLELAQRALEIAPESDGTVRTQICLELAGAYQQMEDYDRAVEAYQMIIQLGRSEANLVSELLGITGLALMALQHGQLQFVYEIASQGIDHVQRSGVLPPICAAVYGELGQVHYHWGKLELARDCFIRASQVSALSGYSDAEIYQAVIFSRLSQMTGDMEEARAEIQKAIDLMQVDAPARVREEVLSQQVRLCLALDQLDAAEAALQEAGFSRQGRLHIPDFEPDRGNERPAVLLFLCAARILLYRGWANQDAAGLQRGIGLADRLIAEELRRQHIPVVLETLLVRAQMLAVLGDEQASRADYARALALAEPEGFISIFVEGGSPVAETLAYLLEHDQLGAVRPGYVKNILGALAKSRPATASGGEQPATKALLAAGVSVDGASTGVESSLTDREVDVLRLMAEGLTYEKIAQRLFISLNTVRSHVKAIYGKLNVNNRTKAIEAARQQGLLV